MKVSRKYLMVNIYIFWAPFFQPNPPLKNALKPYPNLMKIGYIWPIKGRSLYIIITFSESPF